MKEPKRITLVLYGLCAVIWTLKVVFSVVYKEYDYFILNALIAIIWIAAFIRWTIRYRSEKGERKKNV
ncbi:hypothetical protein D3Z39_09550 [Anaerotruncus colihominis]|jgi:hypothetical protein|uniref:Uncharacterized protein n=1 Tax=Anaerotruncus colihominis TaxID=169435 RepID=A0A845RN75_9FIRM|nr:hypothetical protein [Anaerotruncus colihominis]